MLAVISPNRIGNAQEAVSPQLPGKGLLDFPHETGPAVYQRRIKLDQRRPGPDLRIRICAGGDTAASDDRQSPAGQPVERGKNPSCWLEQGRPAETARLGGARAP